MPLRHRAFFTSFALGSLALGLATSWLTPDPGWILSIGGAALGFGVFYGFARLYGAATGRAGLGGGDVKLLAMLGAFVGPEGVFWTILFSSVLGSVVGIGWALASELVLTGEALTPERAAAMGLVNRVCGPGGLGSETLRLVGSLTSKSPAVLREAKRALREGAASDHEALARIERRYLESLMSLEDAAEGILAFMEKREPRFMNR